MDAMRRRLRLAYVDGAEQWSRQNNGRSLTDDELTRLVSRYAGR